MERADDVTPIRAPRAKDDPGPPRPEPVDVLQVLDVALDPGATAAAKADVLKQVREARERARRDRPRRT